MLYTRLHHRQFDLLRRCYERNLLVQELNSRAKQAPPTPAETINLHRARRDLANDKATLQRLRNIEVTLDEVNEVLERLCSLSPERAQALIDKWEYKARQR